MHFRAMMGRHNRQVDVEVLTEFQSATTGGSLPSGAQNNKRAGSKDYTMVTGRNNAGQKFDFNSTVVNNGIHSSSDQVASFLQNVVASVAQHDRSAILSRAVATADTPCDLPSELICQLPNWKRAFDIAVVLVTLPLWLPVVTLIALWIAITSPGPVFYRQARIGHRGRRFMIFKFRTMKVNAETRTHEEYLQQLMSNNAPMQKLDSQGDPRLIFGGRLLRAIGLDELPQIFNVLFGEMSIVGPRPCTVTEFEHFEPSCRARVAAVPGITGWWQVNGKNKTTFREMIEMDIYYARHLSFALDLKILLRTIPAILNQVFESSTNNRSMPAIAAAAK